LVLMMCDPEKGPWIITALVAAVPTLIGGWFLVRNRVTATTKEVSGPTGDVPELAAE
jgi:L-asparagine permease